MTLIVGNLLVDVTKNSFISLEEARLYLADEAIAGNSAAVWLAAEESAQEASLVRASRWLASAFVWYVRYLEPNDLSRVARAATRLAVEALTVDLYEATQPGQVIQQAKAGEVSITYDTSNWSSAQGAGRVWPWLLPYLTGLVCTPGFGAGAMVV